MSGLLNSADHCAQIRCRMAQLRRPRVTVVCLESARPRNVSGGVSGALPGRNGDILGLRPSLEAVLRKRGGLEITVQFIRPKEFPVAALFTLTSLAALGGDGISSRMC